MTAPAGTLGRASLHPGLLPAAVGVTAAAACATLLVVDPNRAGAYPTCPFLAVTGLQCPGCGTMRALHALLRLDMPAAVGFNVLTVALLPVLVWAWVAWWRHRTGRRPAPPRLSPRVGYAVAAVVPVFWVLRNLPAFAFLAP